MFDFIFKLFITLMLACGAMFGAFAGLVTAINPFVALGIVVFCAYAMYDMHRGEG